MLAKCIPCAMLPEKKNNKLFCYLFHNLLYTEKNTEVTT